MLELILIFVVGFFTGYINVLGGGGSLLSLPLLIFIGLPPSVANATNRLAIFTQNLFGILQYQKKKQLQFQGCWFYLIPGLFGSLVGSMIAVDLDEELFKQVISVVLFCLLATIIIKPSHWEKKRQINQTTLRKTIEILTYFCIGCYGGFIQAGVGFFLISGFVLVSGIDLKRANIIKIVFIFFYTIIALIIFQYNQLIDYKIGLVLACGSAIGGWLGAISNLNADSKFIRWFLIICILMSSIKLSGWFDSILPF